MNRIEYILLPNQGPFQVVENVHIYVCITGCTGSGRRIRCIPKVESRKLHIINAYMETNTNTHIQTTANQTII